MILVATAIAVVLLTVIDTEDFGQFIGVADTMRAEARNEAERTLDGRIARIAQIGSIRTATVIRQGRPAEATEAAAAADPGPRPPGPRVALRHRLRAQPPRTQRPRTAGQRYADRRRDVPPQRAAERASESLPAES